MRRRSITGFRSLAYFIALRHSLSIAQSNDRGSVILSTTYVAFFNHCALYATHPYAYIGSHSRVNREQLLPEVSGGHHLIGSIRLDQGGLRKDVKQPTRCQKESLRVREIKTQKPLPILRGVVADSLLGADLVM